MDKDRVVIGADVGLPTQTLTVRKCLLRRGLLVPRGEPETLTLLDAIKRLAPSGERGAKLNVLHVRPNSFIGLIKKKNAVANFVISNVTMDGDIRWLLQKNPEIESQILEVYRVDHVYIPRNAIDLPGDPERA